MIVDLHTHSDYSDGSLNPQELILLAEKNNVDVFTISDHDNIDAYQDLLEIKTKIKIITGIEFSTMWNKIGIHIVGLNFNLNSKSISEAITTHKQIRMFRAQKISARLEKIGLQNSYQKLIENCKQIGRPDFARLLIQENLVKDWNQAFKKYLGAGKLGDVKSHWIAMPQIVNAIKSSGGHAVLAHPLYYKLTNSKLNQLVIDFKQAGGTGIEIVNGFQNPEKTNYLIRLCKKHELLASVGSDFHHPNNHKRVGCQTDWINSVEKIWDLF